MSHAPFVVAVPVTLVLLGGEVVVLRRLVSRHVASHAVLLEDRLARGEIRWAITGSVRGPGPLGAARWVGGCVVEDAGGVVRFEPDVAAPRAAPLQWPRDAVVLRRIGPGRAPVPYTRLELVAAGATYRVRAFAVSGDPVW